jgi:hypothetical protein
MRVRQNRHGPHDRADCDARELYALAPRGELLDRPTPRRNSLVSDVNEFILKDREEFHGRRRTAAE